MTGSCNRRHVFLCAVAEGTVVVYTAIAAAMVVHPSPWRPERGLEIGTPADKEFGKMRARMHGKMGSL